MHTIKSIKSKAFLPDFLLLATLFLIACTPFFHLLFQNDYLIYSSDINYFFPHEIINRQLLSEYTFPLWNPYFGGGSPQLGKIQTGLLYPPVILLRLLPPIYMFNWDAIIHLFFAGSEIFVLSRHWQLHRLAAFSGALIFMFSGAILPRIIIGHVSIVHTVVWAGWILWAYDRLLYRRSWWDLLLTVCFTIFILLGGHPQISVIVLLIPATYFGLYALSHYTNKKAIILSFYNSLLVVLFSVGLLAIQLLPYLEWLGQTGRGHGNFISSLSLMTRNSLNIEYLINLFTPLLWFSPTLNITIGLTGFTHFWEASPFITVSALFILLVGIGSNHKTHRWLVHYLIGLAIIGLMMSMGRQNPIYDWLFDHYPLFRAPGRFLLLWTFPMALLAGFSLNTLLQDWASRHHRLKKGQKIAIYIFLFSLIM